MIKAPKINKHLLRAIDAQTSNDVSNRCRKSFYFFLKEFWPIIIPEEPVLNWHIKYLCNQLQRLVHDAIARKPKKHDIIINIPPGTTKTTICSIALPAWAWIAELPYNKYKRFYRKKRLTSKHRITGRDLRIITGSYAQDITLINSLKSRDIIKSRKYAEYFPEIQIRTDQDTKSDYANTFGGQRFSTSVGSRVMGQHAHLILVDDPIDPEQTLSDAIRGKANIFMDNLNTRKVNKKNTPIVLIMQRLHKYDPTGHVLDKSKQRKTKVKHICLPGTTEYEIKPAKLKKRYKDGLLDPVRLAQAELDDLRVVLGAYGYSGQIGQDPRPREGGMFNRTDFEVVAAAPASKLNKARGWDLAATSEAEAKIKGTQPAYTSGVRMSYTDGIFYIEEVRRFRGGPAKVRRRMKNTASVDGLETIQDFPQDPGQAGKAQARSLAAHLAGYRVTYSPESGDKILRAEPFSAQCQAGNVKLVMGPWVMPFLDEADYFPNGFKDQIDAAVRAFKRILILKAEQEDTEDICGPGGYRQENRYKGAA